MSVKKFMHPRNIYRKPPDFKDLALKYPEFRKFAHQDLSGKVTINFKDAEALRALSRCLLHHDFNLTVDIPQDRLVPTIPLRLNYLLWLEDILIENSLQSADITGIDIGTGASCVYPLIGAAHFKWHMLATEIDEVSYQVACKNVEVNNLQSMITVKKVSDDTLLASAVDKDRCYEFCMCNPPFYSCETELDPKIISHSRKLSRAPPHNAPTGSTLELASPGGEIGFIKRMLHDSMKLKNLIRVYTVMMGFKSSVKVVEGLLREANVLSIGTTEFFQGHTTRWGIAWTYDPTIVLSKVLIKDYPKKIKKDTPFILPVQEKIDCVVSRIKELMSQIQVEIKTLESNSDFYGMELIAEKNTWIKQRRYKREHWKHVPRKDTNCDSDPQDLPTVTCSVNKEGDTKEHIAEDVICDRESKANREQSGHSQLKRPAEDNYNDNLSKRTKTETAGPSGNSNPVLMVASLVVRRSEFDTSVIEISWLGGVGGKDLAHQLLQYIKNKFEQSQV